jgi:hypothetical protein
MTWSALEAKPKAVSPARALISLSLLSKRGAGRLFLTLPIEHLPSGWQPGVEVDAFVGRKEHLGKLRLRRVIGGDAVGFILYYNGRAAATARQRLSVKLSLPDGVAAERHAPEEAELERDGDDLVISLPRWAWPADAVPEASAPKAPARGGATSVTARIFPDPPACRSAAKR